MAQTIQKVAGVCSLPEMMMVTVVSDDAVNPTVLVTSGVSLAIPLDIRSVPLDETLFEIVATAISRQWRRLVVFGSNQTGYSIQLESGSSLVCKVRLLEIAEFADDGRCIHVFCALSGAPNAGRAFIERALVDELGSSLKDLAGHLEIYQAQLDSFDNSGANGRFVMKQVGYKLQAVPNVVTLQRELMALLDLSSRGIPAGTKFDSFAAKFRSILSIAAIGLKSASLADLLRDDVPNLTYTVTKAAAPSLWRLFEASTVVAMELGVVDV